MIVSHVAHAILNGFIKALNPNARYYFEWKHEISFQHHLFVLLKKTLEERKNLN